MKVTAILTAVVLGAASAWAASDASAPAPRTDLDCGNPSYYNAQTGIIFPTAGTKVKAGVPFEFGFCSDAYFKTSTIELFIGFDNGKGDLNLLAANVGPGQYHQNLVFNASQAGTGKLVVYEVQNGYYNRYNFDSYSVQLQVVKKL